MVTTTDRGAVRERDRAEAAARTVRMLAVLLQAGAAPEAAWRHLATAEDPVAERVAVRIRAGEGAAAAMTAEGPAWADAAAAWAVAESVGAPLAQVLRDLADALRETAEASDEVRIALAEPASTARLLLWLPLAGLALGVLLGFDPLGAILHSPLGAGCALLGGALVLLARWWTARLVRRAQPSPGTPGMHAELVAIALAGGASIDRGLLLAARGRPGPGGQEPGRPVRTTRSPSETRSLSPSKRHPAGARPSRGGTDPEHERTRRVLTLSRDAGVPAHELLRAAAAEERHRARVAGRMAAARLSSRLLLPIAVCTLPAFLLLGIVPLVLGVLAGTALP